MEIKGAMFISNVMCMKCNKTIATVKFTKIIEGKPQEIHLCQECASALSPYQKKMHNLENAWNEILAQLLGKEKGKEPPAEQEQPKEKIDLVCDNCGLPFESYRKSPFLGCSLCYNTFHKYLISDIRKIHGGTQHVGKVPGRYRKIMEIKRSLDHLRHELQDAIKMENYERAAVLRDKIKTLSEQESSSIESPSR